MRVIKFHHQPPMGSTLQLVSRYGNCKMPMNFIKRRKDL